MSNNGHFIQKSKIKLFSFNISLYISCYIPLERFLKEQTINAKFSILMKKTLNKNTNLVSKYQNFPKRMTVTSMFLYIIWRFSDIHLSFYMTFDLWIFLSTLKIKMWKDNRRQTMDDKRWQNCLWQGELKRTKTMSTNNGLQNTTQKTKDWWSPLKTGGEPETDQFMLQ